MNRLSAILLLTVPLALPGCGKKKGGDDVPTDEAKANIQKIFDGAKSYFESRPAYAHRTGKPPIMQFPKTAPLTPAKPCCKGKGGRCPTRNNHWNHHTWQMVGFEISDPHLFQYQFISSGTGTNAKFTIRAVADKNCDGKYLVLEKQGKADKELRVRGSALRIRKNVAPPFK